MAFIVLMRHGESEGNAKRIFCGRRTSCHLTQKGNVQAEAAASLLARVPLEGVYTSPMTRAVETAKIVASRTGVNLRIDERYTEVDMGKLEGKSIDEVSKVDSEWYRELYDANTTTYGLEKYASVTRRVMDGVSDVLDQHSNGNVLVVSHMDPIRCVVADVLRLPLEVSQQVYIGNASLTIVRFLSGKPRLMALNVMDLPAYFTYMR